MITYAPSTIASMHTLFSGTNGNRNGTNNYWAGPLFKKEEYKTLPQYFQDEDYYTRGDSINKIAIPSQGFDKLTIHNEFEDDLFKLHPEILEEVSKKKKKFFLYLHYSYIHARTTRDVIKKYKDECDERYFINKKQNSKNFDGYMKEADDYLGLILEKCEELGFLENTIIFVLSDHGTGIGERVGERRYGYFCYDYTLKCFLILFQPKMFKLKSINKVIRSKDVAPTILEFAEIKQDKKYKPMGGSSIVDLIKGKDDSLRIAFSETAGADQPGRKKPNVHSIRTDKWKLIYNSISKKKEFYNLEDDPSETNNLAGKNLAEEELLWEKLLKEINIGILSDIQSISV